MELRHLRAFVVLAEELHFGRAARRLGLVQSALSRTVLALEEHVGATLLLRTSRRVALTAAGEAFLGHARATLKCADAALRAARLGASSEVEELHLGMMSGAAQPSVGRLLAQFARRHPEVRVTLRSVDERRLGAMLAKDELDAIIAWEASAPAGCQRQRMASIRLAVLLPEEDSLARKRAVSLSELADRQIILLARDTHPIVYERFRSMCRDHGFELTTAMDAETISDVFALVSGGAGVGTAPVPLEQRYPGVVILPLEPPVDLEYQLIWTQPSRQVERLVACILDSAAQ